MTKIHRLETMHAIEVVSRDVPQPATVAAETMTMISRTCQIAKLNEAKRLVTGWASVVTKADGTPIVDHQGDVISIDDLEDAFIEAFADGGISRGGEMHKSVGGADIVGQFTLSRGEREALGFGTGVEGAIVKVRVNDDELWRKVASGEYSEFSIAGVGRREELAA